MNEDQAVTVTVVSSVKIDPEVLLNFLFPLYFALLFIV